MTLQELKHSEKTMLSAQETASLIGMHPQTLNLKAKNNDLPFPFIRSGNRTKIPRLGLLKWLGAEVDQQ